ncbi:hypothetical protein [Streptomyces sp. NPDC089919]|uniref:hypothetical protein n=1 Tax=Streptomyces sp. NPDC089919 TaxID=3155188 RepID=UPI003429B16A
MNETTKPAAVPADGHALPETPAPGPAGEAGADPLQTLLDTVATCRPLDEVSTLLAPLKESGRHPDLVREALCTAAVTRPVEEVGQVIDALGTSPQERAEAELLLRTAAVQRPMADVARLVDRLAGTAAGDPAAGPRDLTAQAPAGPEPLPGYAELPPAWQVVEPAPPPAADPADEPWAPARWQTVLRGPVVVALLALTALHFPGDPAGLAAAAPGGGLLPAVVAALCLAAGAALALRATAVTWWAAALTAAAVLALHLVGRATALEPLAHAVGGTVPWADAVAVLCAGAAATLAMAALRAPAAGRTASR